MGLLIAMTIYGCTPKEYSYFPELSSTIVSEMNNAQNAAIDNSEVKNMYLKEEILKLVNNDNPADELIKTIYSEAELKPIFSLSRILKERPPECVRYSNEKPYLIYKYDTNKYLFILYNSIEEDSFPISPWYIDKSIQCKDFEDLAYKAASLTEVQGFDPHGSYTSLYSSSETSLYTFHYTIDGYLIRFDYISEIGKPVVISKITKFSGEDNPIYHNLLPIDKELVSKQL